MTVARLMKISSALNEILGFVIIFTTPIASPQNGRHSDADKSFQFIPFHPYVVYFFILLWWGETLYVDLRPLMDIHWFNTSKQIIDTI